SSPFITGILMSHRIRSTLLSFNTLSASTPFPASYTCARSRPACRSRRSTISALMLFMILFSSLGLSAFEGIGLSSQYFRRWVFAKDLYKVRAFSPALLKIAACNHRRQGPSAATFSEFRRSFAATGFGEPTVQIRTLAGERCARRNDAAKPDAGGAMLPRYCPQGRPQAESAPRRLIRIPRSSQRPPSHRRSFDRGS